MWESKTTGLHSAGNIGLNNHVDRWRGTLLCLQRKTWFKKCFVVEYSWRSCRLPVLPQLVCEWWELQWACFQLGYSNTRQIYCEKEQSLMRTSNCCPVASLVSSVQIKKIVSSVQIKQIELTVWEKMCLDPNVKCFGTFQKYKWLFNT